MGMKGPSIPGDKPSGRDAPASRAVGFCGLAVLVVACFGPALFAGRQFFFRDAGHFYYPLYWSIQQQWHAGTFPLWEPGEDGGMPLLGSPQAAVLYPGKLIFAALPYPWAARLYIVAHVLLAYAAMRAMLRSWGVGASGSTLAGLAYAFGTPVLFQYSNVIYLVGAAWAPLGFRSADGWLRLGRRWALLELSGVLAMQALGGDLEAAYVTGLCSAGYAVALASRRRSSWIWVGGMVAVLVGWASLVASLGPKLAVLRSGPARSGLALAWGIALLVLFARGVRGRGASPLGARMLGLAASAVLAVTLGAIQLVPVAENVAASFRWGASTTFDFEEFSLEPYRAVEWAWPNAFGSMLAGERMWLRAIRPKDPHRVWIPSLYFGTLPLALALGAAGFRGGPPWRGWLTAVALLGFLAAAGKFVDPSAWLGYQAGGSVYRLMVAVLPGFGGFRFPSKLLVFVGLALAGLAGIGWDRVVEGKAGRSTAWSTALLGLGLLSLAIVGSARGPILKALADSSLGRSSSLFGPFDPQGVWADMLRSSAHAAIASALALALIIRAGRRPLLAGSAAILILAVDLSVANAGLIFTLPQADFDRQSGASRILREAEGPRRPGGRPRIFRMGGWAPSAWNDHSSRTRLVEVAEWERDTLFPNLGLLEGIESIYTESGAVEPEDYESFFRPYFPRIDAKVAASIGAEPGQVVFAYPRRAFDLWNVRYFLLPVAPGDWKHGNRALISFLDQTELVYPRPGQGPDRPRLDDFQVRRNLAALPRAWTVHDFVAIDPRARGAAELIQRATQYLARGPSSMAISKGLAIDPRVSALIEAGSPEALDPYRPAGPPGDSELPKLVDEGPSRVELSVTLERPGLVVLADRFDPGWRATIDGVPAAILKANHLMRATAVGAGSHRIVFVYDPPSFRLGVIISLIGLVATIAASWWAIRQLPEEAAGDIQVPR
jgi:hypothetical protein